ncbi:hypothetical protein VIBRN418_00841 [Vibrio sp. N418]|uniref:hypothetical protein n=1 Tax=Vibrio sp. (strain N418) TaxID=701176 RepID=UPI00021C0A20|nr:hypothetical protein [Vibrio sp. N418]EGU33630.1 hypothetical protein VIBRN418_00841 [Vibrio sp. N418]
MFNILTVVFCFLIFTDFHGFFESDYLVFKRITIVIIGFYLTFLSREIDRRFLLILISVLILLLIQNSILISQGVDFSFIRSVLYILPCYISFYVALKHFNWYENIILRRYIFFISIVLLSVECYLRFSHPDMFLNESQYERFTSMMAGDNSELFLYKYKFSSLMYVDSNYTGNYALLLFVFSLITFRNVVINNKKRFSILLIYTFFIYMSLSRAAIITQLVISLLYIFCYVFNSKVRILVLNLILLLIITALSYVFVVSDSVNNLLVTDKSFLSKIESLFLWTKMYDLKLINSLFGFGSNIGSYVYSLIPGYMYAHLMIYILLGEFGVIGLFLYFLFWSVICKANPSVFFIFISMFIVGLSLVQPWDPIYFFVAGLMMKETYNKFKFNYE